MSLDQVGSQSYSLHLSSTLEARLARMTVEDKVGTLLITMLDGETVEDLLRRFRCGAFLVWGAVPGGHETGQLCALANRTQSLSAKYRGLPVWLHGWVPGLGWRPGWLQRAHAVAVPGEVEQAARIFGQRWRAVGWHNLPEPCLNVPLFKTVIMPDWITCRVPTIVRTYGLALTRGVLAARCGTMAQHYPAHGATPVDSHTGHPVVDRPWEELWRDHIEPYQACFDAGCTSLCTAHLACMPLDPDPAHVVTTSPRILLDFTRRRLGFRGMIIADALEMEGFLKHGPLAVGAVDAINAGCDCVCMCDVRNVEPVFVHLVEAVCTGQLPMLRLDDAVRHHLRFMDWLGLFEDTFVQLDATRMLLENEDDNTFLARVAGS